MWTITNLWICWPHGFKPLFFKQPNPLLFQRIRLLDTANQNNISYLLTLALDRNQTLLQGLPTGMNRGSHGLCMTLRRICLGRDPSQCRPLREGKVSSLHRRLAARLTLTLRLNVVCHCWMSSWHKRRHQKGGEKKKKKQHRSLDRKQEGTWEI